MAADNGAKSMEELVSLCKRRGFIYPASEIYGGINGFWDYGPLGVQLKNNLRDDWWRSMTLRPPKGPDGRPVQIVGLDSSIIQNPKVWEASGHVGGFSDPMQTCRQCKKLFRADHVPDLLRESEWVPSLLGAFGAESDESFTIDVEQAVRWARKHGRKLAAGLALVRKTDEMRAVLTERSEVGPLSKSALIAAVGVEPGSAGPYYPCPGCGGDLTEPREFNLMFETHAGAVKDDASKVYLRPETAQGIFINFKNVVDTMRVKVPFGIAQVGKAFRNEVTPRNFVFRSREFEQMEMEWFCHASEAGLWMDFWKQVRMDWWLSVGASRENLIFRQHDADELSHYAKNGVGTWDIEYRWPFTAPRTGELEGISHRSNFDLSQHDQHSSAKLVYFDDARSERYLPDVIEPAAGLTRGVLLLLCEAFTPDPARPSQVFMKFHPRMAPIKAAVYPLVNKDGMPEVAEKLHAELTERFGHLGIIEYDAKQNIGKRYARMDEVGCPFCFTVDGDTLSDQAVTVRDRDTTEQHRLALSQVGDFLAQKLAH
ncbi:MAG: glycine--tRNA ligase [Planctomycetota bacterium]